MSIRPKGHVHITGFMPLHKLIQLFITLFPHTSNSDLIPDLVCLPSAAGRSLLSLRVLRHATHKSMSQSPEMSNNKRTISCLRHCR